MKLLSLTIIILFAVTLPALSQKYYTKNGLISFLSRASIENIKADNNQVIAILNTQNGEFQFSLNIKNFHFEKALMEEHFNEDYLESDRFPKAGFKGNIINIKDISFNKDGQYKVNVAGNLEIHGVIKEINTTGILAINGGVVSTSSKFFIRLSDYHIGIPKTVIENISGSVELWVQSILDQKL